jgi:hypothetical protein
VGALVLIHAESESLLQDNRERLRAAGRTDIMAHPESRPPFVEDEAVHRALFLAAKDVISGVVTREGHVRPPAREGGRAFVSNSISVARAVAVRAAGLFN